MKKVGDLFQELGFNANASDDVKIAFIKNLVKAAYAVEVTGPKSPVATPIQNPGMSGDSKKLEQLSFNFEVDLKKAN